MGCGAKPYGLQEKYSFAREKPADVPHAAKQIGTAADLLLQTKKDIQVFVLGCPFFMPLKGPRYDKGAAFSPAKRSFASRPRDGVSRSANFLKKV